MHRVFQFGFCISRILKTICQCNGDSSGVVNIWWWKWNYLFSEMTKAIDGFVEDSATVIMVVYSIQETLFVEYENKTDEGTRLMIMWMMMRGVVGGTADDVGQQAHDPSTATSQYIHIYSTVHTYGPQCTQTCSTVLHSTHTCSTVHTYRVVF